MSLASGVHSRVVLRPLSSAPARPLSRSATPCTSLLSAPLSSHRVSKTQSTSSSWALSQPTHRASSRTSRRSLVVTAAGRGSPDVADRVVAAIPYLVPLCDGLRYGRYFFVEYPAFTKLLLPLQPFFQLYFSFPFASLIVFFAVYLGIVNNQSFSRYVRYNAMQAVLLDIILILPGLIEGIFRPPMGGPGLQFYISAYNTIWLFVFASVAYGVGSCLVGQTARLPLVADAADQQIR